MVITRRKLLSGAAALAAFSALGSPARAASGIIAGAIRFDAWYDTTSPVSVGSQNSLGPQIWQGRSPWFCQAANAYQVSCIGTQPLMDLEISYAAAAGLKYWAFLEWAVGDPLRTAWNLYQASASKNNINWCWISNLTSLGFPGNFATQVANYTANMQQSNWQTVLSGRPLWYIFWNSASFASRWGSSFANLAAMITSLRSSCASAGIGNPYIVVLDAASGTAAATEAAGIGADASGFYNWSNIGTYAQLSTSTQAAWVTYAAAAAAASVGYVPTIVSGWDSRPIYQNPPAYYGNPWNYQHLPTPNVGMLNFAADATSAQVASQASAAVTYITATNPTGCASKAALIYSWDECIEGGKTLIPTIGDPPVGAPPSLNGLLTALAPIIT